MIPPSSGPAPLQTVEREIGFSLQRFAHWTEKANAYAAKRLGLHVTDLSCIGYLQRQAGPISAKQVIDYFGISSGSGTGLIDRLESAGYVRRIPNPDDRRGILIELVADQSGDPLAFYTRLQAAFAKAATALDHSDMGKIIAFLDSLASVDPIDLLEQEPPDDLNER